MQEFRRWSIGWNWSPRFNGDYFYNDSKATNVDATVKALESFPANIHLILGGKDKGTDYTVAESAAARAGEGAYPIGAAADKIASTQDSDQP